MKNVLIFIPARYNSSRLKNKMLIKIKGKTLLERTYSNVFKFGFKNIFVLTDSIYIKNVSHKFKAKVFMTSMKNICGSERIAEIIFKLKISNSNFIVNIQGDEPFVSKFFIKKIINNLLINEKFCLSTLICLINKNEKFNFNKVKVLIKNNGSVLYFSRYSIPWNKFDDTKLNFNCYFYKHIGIYVYRTNTLKKYILLKPSYIEIMESLEQLRFLFNSMKIGFCLIKKNIVSGIDTKKDLEKLN